MTAGRLDFDAINRTALGQWEALVARWCPDGQRAGAEWVARNPTRSDKSRGSFSVNLRTGQWADFSTGDKGGDPISLYAYLNGMQQADAARALADLLGVMLAPSETSSAPVVDDKQKERSPWRIVLPVPDSAGEPHKAHIHRGKPQAVRTYRDLDGRLLGYVYRFLTSTGGKDDIPHVYAENSVTGERGWRWMGFPSPRPLYNLPDLAQKPSAVVLLVEGEKCVDVAAPVLPEFAVVSWPGGCKALEKVDWTALQGRHVILWPDADAKRQKPAEGIAPEDAPLLAAHEQPGLKAMLAIAAKLRAMAGSVTVLEMPPPGELPDGWDIADAIEQGMGHDDLLAWIQARVPSASSAESSLTHLVEGARSGIVRDFARYTLNDLLANFSLVYGTDACWDAVEEIQMRLAHLRHLVGRDLFKAWDEHPSRRVIRGLVFEPGGETPANHINLFKGLPLKPGGGADGCKIIREHIWRLCQQREEEFFWLMRWIAFPLRNPGAKMASSVIMYGSEGPGKSILWERVVRPIYGDVHVTTVGQAELEEPYTAWQSRKLLAICEEVVTRSHRAEHKGKLKHLITGRTLQISEKFLPKREETNHLNFVFLSNSTVPLELDFGDRRYMVLYCASVPDKAYFTALFEEIRNGGVEAFYEYLLSIDMADFDEHTKPPLNEEKEHLIEFSLPSPILFLREWMAGDLGVPYCSCPSSALFEEYRRWCERKNEFKKRDRDFTAEVRRVLKQERHDLRLQTGPGFSARKTTRVWVTPADAEKAGSAGYVDAIDQSCVSFLEAQDKVVQMGGRRDVA